MSRKYANLKEYFNKHMKYKIKNIYIMVRILHVNALNVIKKSLLSKKS